MSSHLKLTALVKSLADLGISSLDSFYAHKLGARDDPDAIVWKCKKSGVFLVQSAMDRSSKYYNEKDGLGYWAANSRDQALATTFEDDSRRSNWLKPLVAGRTWCDVGTGLGGILDLLQGSPSEIRAVEPQLACRSALKDLGFDVTGSIEELAPSSVDVCTLFHVFEHLDSPVQFLRSVKNVLKPGGMLVVEVPHARDALLERYKCPAFEAFTFWTEHQLLHTKDSLRLMVESARFRCKELIGLQRYPLANHLFWLAEGKPGGHMSWKDLASPSLDAAYSEQLIKENLTDTIIGVFVSE